MGVFSQMNLEMQERTSTTQSGMFSKAEELDDARQAAEAEAAKATLAKLTEDSEPSDEAPAEENTGTTHRRGFWGRLFGGKKK